MERDIGSAADLLGPWPAAESRVFRVVRAGRVRGRGAVVLGSTQDRAVVDDERAAAADIDVIRRSTGGGAVLVGPGAQVWLDVWLPRRDALWDDDIVRSAGWLGDTWARALGTLGVGAVHVHRGPARRGGWSELVCFAGLGPGEVSVGERKVVGLAQRRTREGARFHTSAPLVWDPGAILALLVVDGHAGAEVELRDVATGLGDLIAPPHPDGPAVDVVDVVERAVVTALP